jgi:glycosyltransferase involved in cell wall biosynthesis
MHASRNVAELLDLKDVPRIDQGRINAIVICYNEAVRLPYFLKFYQSLGVDCFLVLDNGSTDGSGAILDANPLVTRFYSNRSFAQHKAIWREALADTFLSGRWVLFADVDELLIYPGWPEHDLHWFANYLEAGGYDALFAPMVDMYPAEPLSETKYEPGSSFIDACPYFDAGNYRLLPASPKKWRTPTFRVQGGARERLFHSGKQREPTLTDRLLLRLLFSLNRDVNPGPRRRRWEKSALKHLKGCLPEIPPNMSKIPLLRWRPGTRLPGGPHRVNFDYDLAPDWGTILHFKYLQDFQQKVEEAVSRGQHMSGAVYYKQYRGRIPELWGKSLKFEGSRRFRNYRSMLDVGLMRASRAVRDQLKRQKSTRLFRLKSVYCRGISTL